ncbi:cytochrome c556 [Sphingomonas kaistensis]|uniref:Cytochrome c556 n=1 Tax=Sphingomonas kaistensis TaxID=298708 RepID=A0A7X6BHP9_9SPHN|nr:cytochrome c [Sphingomonas kaistensis]NJC06755.1 cytochrome c556 [Sphingomonas kaistensis]
MRSILLISAALLSLSACNRGGDEANAVLNDANASGAEATATVTNTAMAAADTPLEREAALAKMKERHDGYEKIGKAMRAAKQAIDKQDLNAVRNSADTIASLAPQAIGWFPLGTGPDVGKTQAKAEIWQQKAEFDKGMTRFNEAAKVFQAATGGGDFGAIKEAHANLGKTCAACHDRFRTKDD